MMGGQAAFGELPGLVVAEGERVAVGAAVLGTAVAARVGATVAGAVVAGAATVGVGEMRTVSPVQAVRRTRVSRKSAVWRLRGFITCDNFPSSRRRCRVQRQRSSMSVR